MSRHDKARVIITMDCERRCPYCCNNYRSMRALMKAIDSVEALRPYGMVMLTGGEPMLDPERTLRIGRQVKEQSPDRPLYLYTALWHEKLEEVIHVFDGVHFTLHASATRDDVMDFQLFQAVLYRNRHIPGSYRVYIHPEVSHLITLRPSLWTRVESKLWLTEAELTLPDGEDLLVLTETPQ